MSINMINVLTLAGLFWIAKAAMSIKVSEVKNEENMVYQPHLRHMEAGYKSTPTGRPDGKVI